MKDKGYKKRTQKDYSMNFKLSVVQEVEKGLISYKQAQQKYGIQGRSTVLIWLRKYGNFDWDNQTPYSMATDKTPEQKLLELEQKVRLLEKQNARLKHQAEQSDKKALNPQSHSQRTLSMFVRTVYIDYQVLCWH